MKHTRLLLAASLLGTASVASAQVIYSTTGSTYTQNFNWTTGSTGTAVTWVDNAATQSHAGWVTGASSLGWYSGFTGTDTFNSTNGSSNSGGSVLSNFFFSSTDTDRSLGGRPTGGNGPIVLGLRLTNTTGVTLTSFTLSYALEITNQRDAGVSATSNFAYLIGNPTNWVSDSFTGVSALNATTPLVAVSTNVNGNIEGNRVSVSSTVSGITWASGTDIWLRWTVPSVTNAPNVGLDDVTFSAIPEPSAFAALAGLGALGLAATRRRRR